MPTSSSYLPSGGAYLVTGCAGFIANRVAAQLLALGHEVVGIDNMNDYYDVGLKEHRLKQIEHPNFTFHNLDIENATGLETIFKDNKFSAIVNLAARAGVRYSLENPYVYMTTNAMGNLNLLELARHHDVPKFVLASTSSLYAGQPTPFVETLPVNTPISPYAASKKSAEMMAYTYHNLFGIDVSVCRYFTVYGPAGRPDMCIFRFIKWIDEGTPIQVFGDGEQSRDFTYVEDIAAGTISAIRRVGFEIINLGGGERPTTLNEIIRQLEELLGKNAQVDRQPSHKADMLTTSASIEKAKELLDWSPQTSLDEGLKACVQWHLKEKNWVGEMVLP